MTTEANTTGTTAPGSTGRRDLIKKAAVGAGVVWAAPSIMTTVAYAQGTNVSDLNCVVNQGGGTCSGNSPVRGTPCVWRAQYGDVNTNTSPFDTGTSSGSMVRYTVGGVPQEDEGQGCSPNVWNNVCSFPTSAGLTGSWTLDPGGIQRTVVFDLPTDRNCAFRSVGIYEVATTARNGNTVCVPNNNDPSQAPIFSVPDTRFDRYPACPPSGQCPNGGVATGSTGAFPCDTTNQRFHRVTFEGVDGTAFTGNQQNPVEIMGYRMFRLAIQCIQGGGPDLCP